MVVMRSSIKCCIIIIYVECTFVEIDGYGQ
jgi:hypothetical protein